MRLLTTLFAPGRVLLVGAYDRPGAIANQVAKNLEAFPGEVLLKRCDDTFGDECDDIGLAVVALRASRVPRIAAELARRGTKALVVLSAGFAEAGATGASLQAELAANAGSARVIGPNCFGIQECNTSLNASIATGLPLGGGISLVSQAGTYAMAARTASQDERMRFSKVIGLGNGSDVKASELMVELGGDPATTTLCFALESMPDARAFVEQARLTAPDKPVILYKSGESEEGARSAATHTGALATPASILHDAAVQAGITHVRSGEELFDAARALDARPLMRGPRVGIISNSGGAAVELVDFLAREGLTVPELSGRLQQSIAAILPEFASPRNPVDVTPVWSRYAQLYPQVARMLATSGEVDAIIAVLAHRAGGDAATVNALTDRCCELRSVRPPIPIYVCFIAPMHARAGLRPLQDAGVPCFDGPRRVARAAGHVYRYAADGKQRRAPLPALPSRSTPADGTGQQRLADLLSEYGVAVAPTIVCRTLDEIKRANVRYPAVVKIASAQHRTELHGVRVGIACARDLGSLPRQ
jgi:acyl-CoA synthetase (NDP forming)